MNLKSSFLFLLLLFLNFQDVCSLSRADSIRLQILSNERMEILVSAHRGDWRNYNENSLSGIKSAIEMGVDIIEIDIQRTQDGHLILMHDETLDRTTTGSGRVDSYDLKYIKTLKLRNGIGIPTEEDIPSLEEILSVVRGRVILNIDKADRYIDEVLQLLKKHKMQEATIVKTEMPFVDVRVRFHDYLTTPIILMPIINLDLPYSESEIIPFLNFMKPKIFELIFSETPHQQVKRVSEKLEGKTSLWFNTLWASLSGGLTDDLGLGNPDEVYGYLIDSLNAKIIQTDRPEFLLNYLRNRRLHD